MSNFDIQPLQRFRSPSAAIRRPKEITSFSYDDSRGYHDDDRSLRYYYTPRLGANLSEGFAQFQQHDDSIDEHLDGLLKALTQWEKRTNSRAVADIITWRGIATKIMATPHDNMVGSGFELNATLFQDSIFIEENHDFKLRRQAGQHSRPTPTNLPSQEMMSYWGYKFETISLLPDTWDATPRDFIEGREEHIVNNNAQYCSVVRTNIGDSRLILAGEVDAIWDAKPINKDTPINWVELKTSACMVNDRDRLKYERKLEKFWIQSFLLGVPKIIVGFRTPTGILDHLEELDTAQIPALVKRSGKADWDGNVCINFISEFFSWLKTTITTAGVWRIRRKEQANVIEVFLVEEGGHGNVLSNDFVRWRTIGTEGP